MYIIISFCTKLIILRTSFKLKLKFILSVNFNNLLIIIRTFILSKVHLNYFMYNFLLSSTYYFEIKKSLVRKIITLFNK